MKSLLLLACLLSSALAQVDLSSYPLSAVLRDRDGEVYTLHWGFDVEAQTIRFAVNVSTTGWVGLGLSPTGGMPNSDVVIGWVNQGGQAFLQDRFAFTQNRPPVDSEQNWFLDGGMEMDGFTILAFRRDWVTCDELDRDIKVGTTRMIYAYNEADPVSDDPNAVMYHGSTNRGTRNLNLLGGQQEVPPDPTDLETFDVTVNNIAIPSSDTTYWCHVEELPQHIQNQTRYITKVSPVLNPDSDVYVHHLIIYECNSLSSIHVGYSAPCNYLGDEIDNAVVRCRGNTAITGWGVGGGEFVYPADVAYPIGGPGAPRYLVMETHYDNPNLHSGIMDSSGMRFSYTSVRRTHDSGILNIGQLARFNMIIPPGASRYKVFAECNSECTSHIPEGGINIFASLLHTHLVGVSITVHHLRKTQNCQNGSGYEELQPIDQNLQYDFNYQQTNHLPRLINVQQRDVIRVECEYSTMDRSTVVLGGESTSEEMCFAFLGYYPRMDLTYCFTTSQLPIEPFFTEHINQTQRNSLSNAADNFDRSLFEATLNQIDWSSEAISSLQTSAINGTYVDSCYNPRLQMVIPSPPAVQCPYEPTDSPCSTLSTTVGPGGSTTEPVDSTLGPGDSTTGPRDSSTEPENDTTVNVGGDATCLSASLSLIICVAIVVLTGMN